MHRVLGFIIVAVVALAVTGATLEETQSMDVPRIYRVILPRFGHRASS